MTKVLWIINKYVHGKREQVYYPSFLQFCQEEMAKHGYQLMFAFFSDLFKESVKTSNNYFYDEKDYCFPENEITKEANRIEKQYDFTFNQAFFPDIIQVSKFQNLRKILIPEKEFSDLNNLVGSFLYLEKIIINNNMDVVFCDQSPEYQMEFGRAICLKYNKIFLRQDSSFLGRSALFQQFEFGKERVVESVYDPVFDLKKAAAFIADFTANKRLPYILPKPYQVKTIFAKRVQNKIRGKKPFLIPYYTLIYVIKAMRRILFKIYLTIEDKLLKKCIEDKFDKNALYLFFGFHLTAESTVALRALPYMNQISLMECISRVLPYGHKLYVREHPYWRSSFSFWYLLRIKKLPNVRLLSPTVPVHEVLSNSRGIITYNATTGIEGLMYGKPILSFAPNIYYGHHPAVYFCSNLYELGSYLIKLISTSVTKQDTVNYICKMFKITNDVLLGSDLFYSEEDAKEKSKKFSKHLSSAINWCFSNNVIK